MQSHRPRGAESMSGELANTGKILIYQNEKGDTKIDVYFAEDTIWMTQRTMAELYQTTPQNITSHIKNIFDDGELEQAATSKDFLLVQKEGNRDVTRKIEYYNLDVIISVGYRVKSNIIFRKLSNKVLKDYIIKGYVVN